jgi:hypothetical protein
MNPCIVRISATVIASTFALTGLTSCSALMEGIAGTTMAVAGSQVRDPLLRDLLIVGGGAIVAHSLYRYGVEAEQKRAAERAYARYHARHPRSARVVYVRVPPPKNAPKRSQHNYLPIIDGQPSDQVIQTDQGYQPGSEITADGQLGTVI